MKVLNLVRHPVTDTGLSPVYQAQQRSWNERYSIHEQNAARWRLTAFGCIAVTFLAVGGLVYDASLSKYVPYIVERDNLGDEVAIGLAQRADTPDLRVIQTVVRRWLHEVRTVSPDVQAEREMITWAYNHTNRSAAGLGELNEWFANNIPWKRSVDSIVTITVTSAVPTFPQDWKTWRANWKEELRTRSGDLVGLPKPQEVSITVSYKPPSTEQDFKKNPEGVFVDGFDWKN
jgi:type IV secretory pathway TrbF-like protein